MILIGASCTKDQWSDFPKQMPDYCNSKNFFSPKLKIAVVSDIHYMDPSIMPDVVSNPDFQKKMAYDRKLIELSDPILRKVVSDLIIERPDILLVTGDLSCEGELVSHETVKGFLQRLENKGIKVYVIPGNNDINNPDAMSYKTTPSSSVPNITPDQFADLYGNFGYNEAIYRDENSLSYICEPFKKLWILGIDANKYSDSGTSGAINPATLAWIKGKMAEANKNNITVLTMMHYGIIEHYAGQNTLEKLVENSGENAIELMNAGIRLIFTGHYHANDIVDYSLDGKTLTDIETGSLVTPLSPYRIMTLDDNFIKIETRRVSSVKSKFLGGMDFLTYSDVTITNRLNSLFTYILRNSFGIPKTDAVNLAPYVTNAFKACFAGDEKISPAEQEKINAVAQGPYPFMVNILNSVWTDLPPKDNKIHIKLK
jgi:3',5'-cyclic AMP phosphodiesterase CpdA